MTTALPATRADWGMDPTKGPYRLYRILRDGEWHTSSELHAAYNAPRAEWGEGLLAGWAWDGAKAQLKRKGFRIEVQRVEGRIEFRHRLTHYPDGRRVKVDQAELAPLLERSATEVERREVALRGGSAGDPLPANLNPRTGPGAKPAAPLLATAGSDPDRPSPRTHDRLRLGPQPEPEAGEQVRLWE